jgi:hypothetical protein
MGQADLAVQSEPSTQPGVHTVLLHSVQGTAVCGVFTSVHLEEKAS